MKKKGKTSNKEPVHKEEKIDENKLDPGRCNTPQVTTYDTINEAIHEYMLKSGLFKTVDSFQVYHLFHYNFSKNLFTGNQQLIDMCKILELDKILGKPSCWRYLG